MRFIIVATMLLTLNRSQLMAKAKHTIIEEEWTWVEPVQDDDHSRSINNEDNSSYLNDSFHSEEEDNWDFFDKNSNDIQADLENEETCEYSCPRYYRPVCVRRNGELITFSTPCEFNNQLRCAIVLKRKGKSVPSYQYLYNGAC